VTRAAQVTRAEIVSEALSWRGTPYRHQHAVKGVGCDCIGLVRGIYERVLSIPAPPAPAYSPSWGEGNGSEILLDALRDHMVPVDHYVPGDVVAFRVRRNAVAKHCAIVVSATHMVHAYDNKSGVVLSAMGPYWSRRAVSSFAFPGVV